MHDRHGVMGLRLLFEGELQTNLVLIKGTSHFEQSHELDHQRGRVRLCLMQLQEGHVHIVETEKAKEWLVGQHQVLGMLQAEVIAVCVGTTGRQDAVVAGHLGQEEAADLESYFAGSHRSENLVLET